MSVFAPRRRTPTTAPADGSAGAVACGPVEVFPRHIRVGDGYAATLAVAGYPAEVGPAWLEPLLSWPGRLDLAIHVDPLPAPIAADRLRKQRARYESSRRADAGKGRLGDPGVDAAAEDAADLAAQLARGVSKLFRVGIYLTVHARTELELEAACQQVAAAAASTLLEVQPATWRHLHGWTTTLPLGHDGLQQRRTMDTRALAAAFPLASPDLPAPLPGQPADDGGVLYGLNPESRGIVWWDRWAQDNHNLVVLARSGAGKSFFVKCETLRHLYDGVQVAVVDPEDEYLALADTVGGSVVRLGQAGVTVNPLDLPRNDKRPDVLTRRALFLHTLVAVLLGEQPTPAQRAALDRAVLATYRAAGVTADPATHHRPAPLLVDLVAQLDQVGGAGAQLAVRLAPWVDGSSAGLFNGPSTHRPDGHLVVWSLRQCPDQQRAAATLLALDAIWQQVDHQPQPGRPTPRRLVVVDEAWLLMRDGEGAKFLYRLAKAGRKRNCGLTIATQDAADVLGTDLGQAVVANAATQVLLRQAPQAIDAVADAFGLTAGERRLLLAAGRGHGLLLAGAHRTGLEVVASPEEAAIASTTPPADLDDDLL
ncbi:hypothetical protein GCM10010123_19830 [Pilimelia anulata]|uniref:TraG P-loop domain-containing protein n=1 Tax=Pilimelia anulata TaxID=53371 RepID=A0A8J3BAA3_9ACTN|nr:conjugal transfer protein TraC [Pilimelia anulata]GGJ90022.1 hypothetical protein GCM10010123_19830 [Pilimelia anulata]